MKYCIDCRSKVGFYSKRCPTCYHRFYSGKNHPLYGKKRTEQVKSKISKKLLGRPSTSNTKFKKGHIPWSKTHGYLCRGEKSGFWKGGKIKKKTGYIMIRNQDHPLADSTGYVLEHRIVMENKLGRPLKKGEVIHHINHNRSDNRPENLLLFSSNSEHRIFEWKIKKSKPSN
jgi:hypothetical protein